MIITLREFREITEAVLVILRCLLCSHVERVIDPDNTWVDNQCVRCGRRWVLAQPRDGYSPECWRDA
jgi:hypothetical protein